jgi:hypothetical protein
VYGRRLRGKRVFGVLTLWSGAAMYTASSAAIHMPLALMKFADQVSIVYAASERNGLLGLL